MHDLNIVYRDLKLENIVICKDGHIKLVDFGFSKLLIKDKRTYTPWGTKGYAAPEIRDNLGHDKSSDIWSFGALFWHMIAGYNDDKDIKLK